MTLGKTCSSLGIVLTIVNTKPITFLDNGLKRYIDLKTACWTNYKWKILGLGGGKERQRERERRRKKKGRGEKKRKGRENEGKERKRERGVSEDGLGNRRERRKDRRWKPCSLWERVVQARTLRFLISFSMGYDCILLSWMSVGFTFMFLQYLLLFHSFTWDINV